MDASTVVAICAVVIAGASLIVSVYEARASRRHDRYSVRPILELTTSFKVGGPAGLILKNSGLGPAAITSSVLEFDGKLLGEFNELNVNKLREMLSVRPAAVTLGGQRYLATDYERFLLAVDPYDPGEHREFYGLIRHRLKVEIHYDSVYGGEGLTAVHSPDH